MEGNGGRLGLSPTDEDSAYDSPRSAENSPMTPPKSQGGIRLSSISCTLCGGTLRDPRCLPCLHTFCLSCLQVKGKKVICPECKTESTVPSSGLLGFLPDFGIINLMRTLKGKAFCTSCKSETLHAVAKCINCDSFLCSNCLMAHNFMHCFSGHRVVEFPKILDSSDGQNEEETLLCLLHPTEPIKYFCYPCNDIKCQTCVNENHLESNHIIENVDKIGGAMLAMMEEKVRESRAHADEFALCIKHNTQNIWVIHHQYYEVYSKIHHTYEQFVAILNKYKEQQLNILETAHSRMMNAIKSNSKISQDSVDRLNRVADFFSRLTKFGTTPQVLMYKKLLETELTHLLSIKAKPIVTNLKLDSEDMDFASSLFRTFGRVVYDINGSGNESLIDFITKVDSPMPFKYEKWSNSCFDDLKNLSDLSIQDESIQSIRPFHLKSNINRTTITYNWKFGSYGSMQGQFTEPNGVCINSEGEIIIADTNNNRVQVFDRSGKFKFSFGDSVGSEGNTGLLFPNRVAVMEKSGDIIVTERAPTHQVQIYNQYGQFIRKFGANVLQHPRAVAVDKDGHIIVVECKVMRVIIFDMMGNIIHRFTCSDILHFPNGVAVNEKQEIFISDNRTHCVVVYNYMGNLLRTIGSEGITNYPIGVMLSRSGHVVVADNHNNFNLTVFTEDGQLVTAMESKVKHAQCYDAALAADGTVALTSKDYRVYVYMTTF